MKILKKFNGFEIALGIFVFFFLLLIVLLSIKGVPNGFGVFCYHNCVFDWWTIPHIIIGFILGFLFYILVSKKRLILFGLLGIVLFELFEQVFLASWEIVVSGAESSANVVSDIVITFIAFLVGIIIVKRAKGFFK